MTASDLTACVVCGRPGPRNRMDLTGHGLRCQRCTLAADVEAADVGSDMHAHLAPHELRSVAVKGRKEVWFGAILCVGGVIWLLCLNPIYPWYERGSPAMQGCFVAVSLGAAICIHGISTRRKALAGLRATANLDTDDGSTDESAIPTMLWKPEAPMPKARVSRGRRDPD